MRRVGSRKTLLRAITYLALIVLGTAFTLPFFWLISTSFKPAYRIQKWPPDIIPMKRVFLRYGRTQQQVFTTHFYQPGVRTPVVIEKRLPQGKVDVRVVDDSNRKIVNIDDLEEATKPGITLSNYTRGLVFIPFFQQLRNTLIISIVTVLGTIISCSLVAYGLSRIEWKGRNALFIILLSTMMLPYQVVMVPLFAIFVRLGWVDTFLPLTVPSFMGNAFFIFLLRQFFMTIPKDLSEAAKLDGCSEFDIYHRVILPLSKPALAMVGLWTFMGAWNDFLGPLIYLVDESKYTLSLGLAMFLGQYGSEYGMLMAVSAVVTVPIIILFFFTQRTFIQGITMTGIKG
jgi:multiple sugar transport system permease protein